jgi:hypothetical protein
LPCDAEVRRTNRFVRLLGVLDLGGVAARRRIVLVAEELANGAGGLRQRLIAQRRRVGAVIGDVTILEEPLRRLHRPLRREAQLAARLLRERRRGEWRGRALDTRLRLNAGHAPRQVLLERASQRGGIGIRQQPHVLADEHAVGVEVLAGRDSNIAYSRQRRPEAAALGRELGVEVGIARGAEGEPLLLTIDNEPDRDALHAARAQAGLDLFPQHRRQRVAIQAIENAPALLRADEVVVDAVRFEDCLVDRFLGDLVKDDALDRYLRLQHLEQVPAD